MRDKKKITLDTIHHHRLFSKVTVAVDSWKTEKCHHDANFVVTGDTGGVGIMTIPRLATPGAASDTKLASWWFKGWQPQCHQRRQSWHHDSSRISVCNNYFCQRCCNSNHHWYPFICLSLNLVCYITYIHSMWRYIFCIQNVYRRVIVVIIYHFMKCLYGNYGSM